MPLDVVRVMVLLAAYVKRQIAGMLRRHLERDNRRGVMYRIVLEVQRRKNLTSWV